MICITMRVSLPVSRLGCRFKLQYFGWSADTVYGMRFPRALTISWICWFVGCFLGPLLPCSSQWLSSGSLVALVSSCWCRSSAFTAAHLLCFILSCAMMANSFTLRPSTFTWRSCYLMHVLAHLLMLLHAWCPFFTFAVPGWFVLLKMTT